MTVWQTAFHVHQTVPVLRQAKEHGQPARTRALAPRRCSRLHAISIHDTRRCRSYTVLWDLERFRLKSCHASKLITGAHTHTPQRGSCHGPRTFQSSSTMLHLIYASFKTRRNLDDTIALIQRSSYIALPLLQRTPIRPIPSRTDEQKYP